MELYKNKQVVYQQYLTHQPHLNRRHTVLGKEHHKGTFREQCDKNSESTPFNMENRSIQHAAAAVCAGAMRHVPGAKLHTQMSTNIHSVNTKNIAL